MAPDVALNRSEPSRLDAVDTLHRARMFEAVLRSTDDAIVTKTLRGRVTGWSPGAERIFGWTAEEMVGRSIATLIPLELMGQERDILQRVAAGEVVDHLVVERLRKDGTTVLMSVTVSPLFDETGAVIGALKVGRDVGLQVQAERVIRHHAVTDPTTGLMNRRAWGQSFRAALEAAGETGAVMAVLMVDVDRFGVLNDSIGHTAGDQVLRHVGQRLKRALGSEHALARLGGDQFLAVLGPLGHADEALPVAQRVAEQLHEVLCVGGHSQPISASVGVAAFPDDGRADEDLLRQAEAAVKHAKTAGGNRAARLSPAQRQAAQDRANLLADLHKAVGLQQLFLLYQPVLDLRSRAVHKLEALVRWQHPVRGLVGPGVFIPMAEEAGLLRQIGDWVFREATERVAGWRQRFDGELQMSVNLSPSQLLAGPEYFDGWAGHTRQLGLPGSAIVFEITEGMVVDDSLQTRDVLQRLRACCSEIAVDDFGTGYSTLSSLSRLDVQYLKIDQSFVRAMNHSPRDLALCRAITSMAHALGLKVVAEGIETEAEAQALLAMGCDFGQGYHLGRPQSATAIEQLLGRAAG